MRLTRAGEYAVRCVLYLSSREKGVVASRKEIASAMDIPEPFLGKIAQQLARAGILEIVQGARGGLRLNMEPEAVTLLDVVEAVIGEIFLNDCIMRPESCNSSAACAVHRVWIKARDGLRKTLGEVSFAEILKGNGECFAPEEKSAADKQDIPAPENPGFRNRHFSA